MANYYCLMAGLPDLRQGDAQPPLTLLDMKEQLRDIVGGADARLVQTYFLRFDSANLAAMLANPDTPGAGTDERGNYSRDELLQLIEEARATEAPVKGYPPFLADIVRTYDERAAQPGWFAADAALLAYYDHARRCPNAMMAEWYELNFNILNILTALIARRQGWPVADYVQGRGPVADALRRQAAQPDFGLGAELDYMPALMRAADNADPVEKERSIDTLRWAWLEERTFFNPFDITALMAYLARTEILERWAMLDPEQGRHRFTQIIDNLRSEARVPEEFVRR